ncbi:DUF808 domain-containing protein [Photobacterium galatheae]|uniref:Membrane protein n=1 Tax=Photobacterium galatheae TaxID=1654360 RepID=A0A066RKX1_9GAMM|nr:DUF808 domain-containing protein [Photobacterium galatheae]KDM89736.1 membrane protein [Photobacterium galatheae]MCM0150360.1 DUF808 domain-containing protein [Photobacterium galatheae]
MAGASLLTLLDDIATVLDDVAVMSKVAARKTAGVLGDDLALNAQQVSGVRAEREIPVVWGVAKGSFKNKLILVPAALLISAIAPWLIMPLLLIGGLYLCFEGAEKVMHQLLHGGAEEALREHDELPEGVNLEEFEASKIKGAIRTDFILSAEIIVIALGTVQGESLLTQLTVVSFIAVLMTIGVYGLVAGIVKLDDGGFYLVKRYKKGLINAFGKMLITAAPKLMKVLAVVGTVAMFLVGGGIVVHSVSDSHHWLEMLMERLHNFPGVSWLVPMLTNLFVGVIAGLLVLAVVSLWQRLRGNQAA